MPIEWFKVTMFTYTILCQNKDDYNLKLDLLVGISLRKNQMVQNQN